MPEESQYCWHLRRLLRGEWHSGVPDWRCFARPDRLGAVGDPEGAASRSRASAVHPAPADGSDTPSAVRHSRSLEVREFRTRTRGRAVVSRLSAMEAVSLHTESSTMPAHTVALIIIEASDQLSHQRLHKLVGSSLPQMARFRSRLVGKPLGLGQPVWAAIDDYDPTPQILSATVPAPGGRREFADVVAGLTTGALDRHKPLWEAWSIDGLEGGRWALAVKMLPAMSDGFAGAASIWPRLLTTGPRDDPTTNLPPEPSLGKPPSIGALVTDTMQELLENQVTGVWLIAGAMPGVLRAAGRRLRGTGEPDELPQAASSMSGPVPRTVFNAPLTGRRAVAFASIPLAHMKTVNNAFGGSVNNVLLAACTLSLRAWLQRHDVVPDHPLLMKVPLSLPDADSTTVVSQFTVGRIRIPVQLDDPVRVLTDLHTAAERLNTARRRNAEKTGPPVDFATIASLIPPTVVHVGMQLYTGLGLSERLAPICDGIVSYISGPAGAGVLRRGQRRRHAYRGAAGRRLRVEQHADLPRRRDGSQLVRVPRQRARSQRHRDRHHRLCRHSGGGRTRISPWERPFSRHRDGVTRQEAFARPTLTGYDQSRSASTRPRWARNVIEPGGETHRRSTVDTKLPVGGPSSRSTAATLAREMSNRVGGLAPSSVAPPSELTWPRTPTTCCGNASGGSCRNRSAPCSNSGLGLTSSAANSPFSCLAARVLDPRCGCVVRRYGYDGDTRLRTGQHQWQRPRRSTCNA